MATYPEEAGIYKLTCVNNGKVYIGKTTNFKRRFYQHKYPNARYRLQNAILKHGWESFEIEILESFKEFDKLKDTKMLLDKEAEYIKLFDSTNIDKGYNLCEYGSDATGSKHTEESKERMRQAKLGKPLSEDHKAKMRKPKSEETKRKMSKSQKGRIISEETKEKMRKSQMGKGNNLGNKHTEESKEKMRQAKLGKSRKPNSKPFSDETKEKIRQAKLEYWKNKKEQKEK